ncbi:hypothetical protein QUF64_10735 [Anaerolineales bacterium HSG6]|nr:hypothetical protein [Anaerolineales bacterium HSG6]
MVRSLVPQGRTHRIAPLIAGLLHYATDIAYEKHGDSSEEGSVAQMLIMGSEMYDMEEAKDIMKLVEQLFTDANVQFERTSVRDEDYTIIESVIYEWFDLGCGKIE